MFVFGFIFLLYIFLIRLGWIGPWIRPRSVWTGPVGLAKTQRAGFGAKKKTHLLNGPGLGNRGGPASWVWISKNPARTQPVAIPIHHNSDSQHFPHCTPVFTTSTSNTSPIIVPIEYPVSLVLLLSGRLCI